MKKKYSIILAIIAFFIIALFCQCESSKSGDIVFIENGKIELGFDKQTGRFLDRKSVV